jgi:uncharacterized protein (DUF1697 family)
MEVHFTPEPEARPAQIADHSGIGTERLVKGAALRGEFAEHAEVWANVEARPLRFSSILRCCNNGSMALIVFFRGINVGGHRAFRPSMLAKELGIYDAVNVGAAGTLVVRKPGLRAKFLAELRRKLPFEATIAFCDGSDLIRLEMDDPFGTDPRPADVVQFVSILSEAGRRGVSLPITLPEGGEWLVRIIGSKNRLVYGVYRRRMKTIGYLGQIDRLFGSPATTRSWNTILSVLRILNHEPGK